MADVLDTTVKFKWMPTYEERQLAVMEDSYKVLCGIHTALLNIEAGQFELRQTIRDVMPGPVSTKPKARK